MIPGMAFATDTGQLYCFYADDVNVNSSNSEIIAKEGKTLADVAMTSPQVEIDSQGEFYFAIKDGDKYKAVKWSNPAKCPITWPDNDKVNCQMGGDEYEYNISISALGDYKVSYNEGNTKYELTVNCKLPEETSEDSATGLMTTLEANFGGESYGNGCEIQAGKSKTVQFCVGKDDGSDMTFDTLIPAADKDFAVYDLNGNETTDIKLTPLADGRMEISTSSSIRSKTMFQIKYIGSEYELNSSNNFTVTVTASASAVKAIRAGSITGVSAKAYKKNIKVSFRAMKNVDGYKIYRSTKKSSGYKLVKTVSKNSFTDTKSLKKGTRYYYKVRGYVRSNDKTYYSKYSRVVSVKSLVTRK